MASIPPPPPLISPPTLPEDPEDPEDPKEIENATHSRTRSSAIVIHPDFPEAVAALKEIGSNKVTFNN